MTLAAAPALPISRPGLPTRSVAIPGSILVIALLDRRAVLTLVDQVEPSCLSRSGRSIERSSRCHAARLHSLSARRPHAAPIWPRTQIQQQAGEPRQRARQVLPVQAQRPRDPSAWREALDDGQVGNRKHLLGRQMPGIAIDAPARLLPATTTGSRRASARAQATPTMPAPTTTCLHDIMAADRRAASHLPATAGSLRNRPGKWNPGMDLNASRPP